MPILEEADLDRRATHQRIPPATVNVNAHGDQTDAYADLQANVPIRVQLVDLTDDDPSDVILWTGWVLPTIANAPLINDRFVLPDRTLQVDRTEDRTDLEGDLDHYQLLCTEVRVG